MQFENIKVGSVILYPTNSSIRLRGVEEKIFRKELVLSKFKVLDIYKDGENKRIVIQKTSGKEHPHDKYFNQEFLDIINLVETINF